MTAPAWRPDRVQSLLLRAAVLTGDEALAAWRKWVATGETGLGAHDPAWRLLPQAYRNLTAQGADPQELAVLKPAYSASWSRNQQLVRRVEPVLDGLAGAEIPILVLKGAALSVLHYGDLGARPMDDIDLLVAADRVEEAVAVLEREGWRPGREVAADLETAMGSRHAAGFDDGEGHQLDLHWYSLWQSAPDVAFWQDSVELTLAGRVARALNPTDQLLHVCVHGCGRTGGGIRWIADAGIAMRSAPIDWDRLVAAARARRVSAITERALRTVEAALGLDVPAPILVALAGTRRRMHERLAERATVRPPAHGAVYATVWDRYRRLRALDPDGPTPRGFTRNLAAALGLKRRADLPRHVSANAGRALARRLSWRRKAEQSAATSAGSRSPTPSP